MAVDAALLGALGVLLVLKSYFQVLTWVIGDWRGTVLYSISHHILRQLKRGKLNADCTEIDPVGVTVT